MQWTPLYNGHYFEVLMECAVERFHCTPILINAIYFLFILFANRHHNHELIKVKQRKVKQALKSMLETLRRLRILQWFVKT